MVDFFAKENITGFKVQNYFRIHFFFKQDNIKLLHFYNELIIVNYF